MSSIHMKLAAIATAIHNAFDFADPVAKLKEAEDEFNQAVADEIKDLTDRVTKLEKASVAAPAPVALVDNSPLLGGAPGSLGTMLGVEVLPTSAAITLDSLDGAQVSVVADGALTSAIVSATLVLDTSQPSTVATDSALNAAIAASAGSATE